jgi:predicted Zn-ribbon and HTH transcriptional regulator
MTEPTICRVCGYEFINRVPVDFEPARCPFSDNSMHTPLAEAEFDAQRWEEFGLAAYDELEHVRAYLTMAHLPLPHAERHDQRCVYCAFRFVWDLAHPPSTGDA